MSFVVRLVGGRRWRAAAVEMLQHAGIAVAVCSNLASPYAAPIKRLYPSMDAFGFSFELGSIKPEPQIYRATCELVDAFAQIIYPGQVIMIGDSQICDRDDPTNAGIQEYYLNRDGLGDFNNLVDFAETVIHADRARWHKPV